MILSIPELELYAPTIDEDAATMAIARLLLLVQGSSGANRPLAMQQFSEVRPVYQNGLVMASRLPISQLEAHEPVVEVRSLASDSWRKWQPTTFEVDYDRGEFQVNVATSPVGADFGRRGQGQSLRRGFTPVECRLTYYTGFDFAIVPPSPEVAAIKQAFGALLEIREAQKEAIVTGRTMTSLNVAGEYSVSYGEGANTAAYQEELMGLFRKYRPREFAS